MAFDEQLARRVRKMFADQAGMDEMKMFGGVGYLLNGNMACGILNSDLIVRVGSAAYADTLKLPGTREFDITGRPMKGWVMVPDAGRQSDADLLAWVQRGVGFALTLPAK
jgi:hypothetical protein